MFPFWPRTAKRHATRRELRARLRVEELESRCLLSASGGPQIPLQATPSEPSFSNGSLYGLTRIEAAKAWDLTTGSSNVSVAVLDTGIDYTHPDLYLNVWVNQTEVPSSKSFAAGLVDTNNNGRVDFYDLNSLDARRNLVTIAGSPVNAAFTSDYNGNHFIDAGDLLDDRSGWEDVLDGNSPTTTNGFVDDLVGWNFVSGNNNPMDGYGHGTHVSGTIGAIGNNGVGVVGVNWAVSIMALRIGDNAGNLSYQAAVNALYYSANNGARVSNNSWIVPGGQVGDPLYNALVYVRDRDQDQNPQNGVQGQLVVAAAGNNGFNNDKSPWRSYPASFDLSNIISVMATDNKDGTPRWTNDGKSSVDLGAPGVNILSTVPVSMGSYDVYSGTSMATPHVVGTAALLLARDSSLSTSDVKAAILNSVDKVSSLATKSLTGGRLNAFKALNLVSPGSGSVVTSTSTSTGQQGTSTSGHGNLAALDRVFALQAARRSVGDLTPFIALAPKGGAASVEGVVPLATPVFIDQTRGQPMSSPSFVYAGGTYYLAGVNTFTQGYFFTPAGKFGSLAGGIALPAYAGWINSVLAAAGPAPAFGTTAGMETTVTKVLGTDGSSFPLLLTMDVGSGRAGAGSATVVATGTEDHAVPPAFVAAPFNMSDPRAADAAATRPLSVMRASKAIAPAKPFAPFDDGVSGPSVSEFGSDDWRQSSAERHESS